MLKHTAWGVGDGRRKNRNKICEQIHKIVEEMTPERWFEPALDYYIESYPRLVRKAFSITRRRAWTGKLVVEYVASLFAKKEDRWMSRADGRCNINHEVAAKLADALNKFDRSDEALHSLVELASQLVNDSMVGGSKFLHFCLPGFYAVTDQFMRLVSAVPPRDPRVHAARREAEYYRTYMAALCLVEKKYAQLAMQWAKKVFGYRVTRIRAIEAFVFYHVREFDYGRLPVLQHIMGRPPRYAGLKKSKYACLDR
ncbi:hypothetical protein SBC2_09800 [Caballeronia sp. SBC2]|nr:hypothetical protein SBC2_09800 [Caballeronia sp. SBC2]